MTKSELHHLPLLGALIEITWFGLQWYISACVSTVKNLITGRKTIWISGWLIPSLSLPLSYDPHTQIQSPGHTEAFMDGCVSVLDTLLPTGVHPSVWLAQWLLSTVRLYQRNLPFHHLSTLHLPLGYLPPVHGLLQLPGMCHGAPAGHDPALRSNLLEPAGPSEGELSSTPGFSAQGEEAGLLLGSGSHFVCHLLDSSAPDELSVAVSRSWCRPTMDPLYRQVAFLVLINDRGFSFLYVTYMQDTYQQWNLTVTNPFFQVFSCLMPTQRSTLWSTLIASRRSNRLTVKYGDASSWTQTVAMGSSKFPDQEQAAEPLTHRHLDQEGRPHTNKGHFT